MPVRLWLAMTASELNESEIPLYHLGFCDLPEEARAKLVARVQRTSDPTFWTCPRFWTNLEWPNLLEKMRILVERVGRHLSEAPH